jgi:hypothetical protein
VVENLSTAFRKSGARKPALQPSGKQKRSQPQPSQNSLNLFYHRVVVKLTYSSSPSKFEKNRVSPNMVILRMYALCMAQSIIRRLL